MSDDPELNRGTRFRIGDAFPSDDALARWATVLSMALNDMVLVQAKLVQPAFAKSWPAYERQYFLRLAASHLYECAVFLGTSESRYPEIRAFVDSLPPEFRDRHDALVALGRDRSDALHMQLERARNSFSHYQELLDRSVAEHEELRHAMEAAQDEVGEIRISHTMRKFRAKFADEIVAHLTLPDIAQYAGGAEIPADLLTFVKMLGDQTANIIAFGNFALDVYLRRLPVGTYKPFQD
jgi:hypothetical protein